MSEEDDKHNEMLKGVAYLTKEFAEKKSELEHIKNTIKQLKLNYNKEIKDYQVLTERILSNEGSIEVYQGKIAKAHSKQLAVLTHLNSQFYGHLADIAVNNKDSKALNILFEFCQLQAPINIADLLSILNNETELIGLFSHCAISQVEAHRHFHEDYESTRTKVNEFLKENQAQLNYPFDSLFEYVSLIYEAIGLEEERKRLESEAEAVIALKNAKFLSLKALEGYIICNDTHYKTTVKYIKGINALLEKNQEQRYDPREVNTFLNAVKHFKSFDFSTCKYDNMNSLSIQSEYSENNSVDTSSLLFKAKPIDTGKLMTINKASMPCTGANSLIKNGVVSNKNMPVGFYPTETNDAKPNERSSSLTKVKKVNTLTHFKKIQAVKAKEMRGSREKKNAMETSPVLVQKPALTSMIATENNDIDEEIKEENRDDKHVICNYNRSINHKDSVCDEKISSTLNPKRIATNYVTTVTNANQIIRKKRNAFYLEFEHSETIPKLPGCCQSCT